MDVILGVEVVVVVAAMVVEILVVVVAAMVVEVIVVVVGSILVDEYCLFTANLESVLEFLGGVPSLASETLFENML